MAVQVTALTGFDHYGLRRTGQQFPVSRQTAEALAARGLVRITGEEMPDPPAPARAPEVGPPQAAGETLSASPAAQASGRKTAKRSASGAKRRKAEPS